MKPSRSRFGELKKSIGTVSQKVLTAQLRDMEEKGLLTRKVYAEVPPRVEYTLTETGYSLKPILKAMSAWGAGYQAKKRNALSCPANLAALWFAAVRGYLIETEISGDSSV